jgi:hypothetical protein
VESVDLGSSSGSPRLESVLSRVRARERLYSNPLNQTASSTPAEPQTVSSPASVAPVQRKRVCRWVKRMMVVLVLALGLLASPLGCTTHIEPPANVREPVTVYLLDHGRTSSLVIPNDDGGMVRYVYGDWTWYALADTGLWNGIQALGWPTQGTLGRQALPGLAAGQDIVELVSVPSENVYAVVVERSAARALRHELDQIHRDYAQTLVVNKQYGLDFVHHPQPYTYFRNSNHMVADWLQRLGCRVRGPAFASRWRVAGSPGH